MTLEEALAAFEAESESHGKTRAQLADALAAADNWMFQYNTERDDHAKTKAGAADEKATALADLTEQLRVARLPSKDQELAALAAKKSEAQAFLAQITAREAELKK